MVINDRFIRKTFIFSISLLSIVFEGSLLGAYLTEEGCIRNHPGIDQSPTCALISNN